MGPLAAIGGAEGQPSMGMPLTEPWFEACTGSRLSARELALGAGCASAQAANAASSCYAALAVQLLCCQPQAMQLLAVLTSQTGQLLSLERGMPTDSMRAPCTPAGGALKSPEGSLKMSVRSAHRTWLSSSTEPCHETPLRGLVCKQASETEQLTAGAESLEDRLQTSAPGSADCRSWLRAVRRTGLPWNAQPRC